MNKSLILKDNQYWDSSSIVYNKMKLSDYMNKISACGIFKVSKTITLNKSVTYGGTEIPFDIEVCNYGNVFELKDNKVYSKVNAIVQMDFSVSTYLSDGYILYGRPNGGYREVAGASNTTSLVGHIYNGSCLIEVSKGDYIALSLGRSSTYSNISVHNTTSLSVSVKRLL